jgi:hypothetical protein
VIRYYQECESKLITKDSVSILEAVDLDAVKDFGCEICGQFVQKPVECT